MKNDLDELLHHVLTPREEAGDILNRKIIEQVKETGNMKQKKYRGASAAVAAAALVAATSLTAFAALHYMSAADVADKLGEEGVAKSFAGQFVDADKSPEDGGVFRIAGESQSYGGYKVTVLGMVSGEDLSEKQYTSNGKVRNDRTYCVVAIEREDGAVMDAEHESYFVSPLIGGLNPGLYNAASLCGGYSEFVENGILYRMLECDNIEYFADHELYLCVTDTGLYDSQLYHYDEASGSITRNTEYEGLNALFTLQMDASLADPIKAQALLDEMYGPDDGQGIELPKEMEDAMEWARQLTPENIEEYCVRMENTVQTVTVDKDGYFRTKPWLVNEAVSDSAGGSGGKFSFSFIFGDKKPGMLINGCSTGGGLEEVVITTLTLNEDGTITFAAWVPKDVSVYLQ